MLKNFIKIAFRNLSKRKGYTLINVLGLSVGIACCIFIALYVVHETSYDSFLDNKDRIYRIQQTSISPSKEEAGATTPFKAGPTLANEYPGLIEHSVRFFDMQEPARTIRYKEEDIKFRETDFYFVDSTFFDVFTPEMIRGSAEQALDDPMTMVLTESAAERYFGSENPVGKVLNFNGVADFTVTAVMEDWPENSHMKIEMLVSMNSLDEIYRGQDYDSSWFWNPCWTYVQLTDPAFTGQLENQLPAFAEKYYQEGLPENERVELDLQPITDINLYSNLDMEMEANNSIFYIYLFSAVAVLILVIACINFMNLSTARSTERTREVGMRKVLGADRMQLFKQFMGESLLMCFLGVVVAVVLVKLLLPVFNSLVGIEFTFPVFSSSYILMGLIALIVIVGFLAGTYPSMFLSRFQPTDILKGKLSKGVSGMLFRKGLVVFQFALSVILIIGTIIVYLQLQHMQTKELGFDKERIIVMPITQNLIAWEFDTFKEEVLRDPGVTSVAGISKVPGSDQQSYYTYYPASVGQDEVSSIMGLYVTHGFFETYNVEVVAGRPFSEEFTSDPNEAVMINESMLSMLNVDNAEEALGEIFYYEPSDGERESFSVIGVVSDFNYTSIKKQIEPLVIRVVEPGRALLGNIDFASVKLAPGNVERGLNHVEQIWQEVNPIDPLEYSFQDEELDKIYASESKMGQVAGIFSGLCIFIACLGLFGLASFTASKRTKEIGIRKTLGASISSIVMLLSKQYIHLVLIANLIAWPLVYYLMVNWLQNFPDRIALGWNIAAVFVATIVLSLAICLLTVSYHSIKAALVNPVETLQQE